MATWNGVITNAGNSLLNAAPNGKAAISIIGKIIFIFIFFSLFYINVTIISKLLPVLPKGASSARSPHRGSS